MPGSTTSVARLPTAMPTLGTIGTSSSGIAKTCSESLTVLPSLTSGGAAVCASTYPLMRSKTMKLVVNFICSSFGLNADVLDDLAESGDVAADELEQRLAGAAGGLEPRGAKALRQLGRRERAFHRLVQPLDDRPRRPGGKREGEIGRHKRVVVAAGLSQRRDLRQQRRAVLRTDGERAQPSVAHESEHRRRRRNGESRLAGDDTLNRRACALVRYVRKVNAEPRLQSFDVELGHARDAEA